MGLWGRWGGNSLFLHADSHGMESGLVTCLCNSTQILYHYLLYFFFSVFLFLSVLASLFSPSLSPPNTILLFSLLSLCIGSGVLAVMWLFVWTQLPVFAIGRFSLKERWFPGWRGMAAPLHFSLQLPPPPLCVALSRSLSVALSLPQAVVDQVAREHDTHRQWQGCVALPPLPLLLFHQAGSHRDH